MLIEYRINLPIVLDRYEIAHLHTTMELSKQFTNSGQGVEILENTACDPACLPNQAERSRESIGKVQRTSKRYHIPDSLTSTVGITGCVLRESSFNKFPYSRTTLTASESGEFTVDTLCKQLSDDPNVFKLPQTILNKRSVVHIDIVNDKLHDVECDDDPKTVLGLKTDWQDDLIPRLSTTVYKLVFIKTRIPNKEKVNALVLQAIHNIFLLFHRKLVCSQERWMGLNMDDIRTVEKETKDSLCVTDRTL